MSVPDAFCAHWCHEGSVQLSGMVVFLALMVGWSAYQLWRRWHR